MTITDKRIIDLFVCHSNFKAEKNVHGTEFETISHKRVVEFARALLKDVGRPAVTVGDQAIAFLANGLPVEYDDVVLIPADDVQPLPVVTLADAAQPAVAATKRAAPMWMVKGKGPANYIHGSEVYALQEAKRLAANHPGEQFTVMVSTKSFVASIEEIDRRYEDNGIPF